MTLRWKCRSTNDSEYATAFFAGLKIVVRDCDGDFSTWNITDPKITGPFTAEPRSLASGECWTADYKTDPYHMILARIVAERCAREIAASRKTASEKSEAA